MSEYHLPVDLCVCFIFLTRKFKTDSSQKFQGPHRQDERLLRRYEQNATELNRECRGARAEVRRAEQIGVE